MKKNIAFITFIAILLIVGCEKEDFKTTHSNFEWYSTQEKEESMFVEVGGKLDFVDVSLNALSHSWTIQEGSYFLERTFTNNDSIYDDFIAGNELESVEKSVSVLFTEPGLSTVRLLNTFDRPVKWYHGESDTLFSTQIEDGLWQIDTLMVVDVFEKMLPAFKVLKNGTEVLSVSASDMPTEADTASWPTVALQEGDTLNYIDLTTIGRPTGRTWLIDVGATEELIAYADTFNAAYNIVGTFLAGKMISNRGGVGAPPSNVEKLIPMKVKVSYSTAPILLNTSIAITENASQVLTVPVTGFISKVQGSAEHFTVHVKNGSFEQDIAVTSVAINTSDATKLELKLADEIYNTDEITVAYDGQGNVTNASGFRVLQAFDATPVEMYWENAWDADMLNFEKGEWPVQNWPGLWSLSTENVFDGTYSYKWSSDNAANTKVETDREDIKFPVGKYKIKLSVYKPAGCKIHTISFYFSYLQSRLIM